MALTPEQRELMSGRHIGRRVDFSTVPAVLVWQDVVRGAMGSLRELAKQKVAPRRSVSGGRSLQAVAPQGPVSRDDFGIGTLPARAFGAALLDNTGTGMLCGSPNLTDPVLVTEALQRYHAGAEIYSSQSELDRAARGPLLVDLYALTGRFMHRILRNDGRTDRDCQLFAAYRGVHFAVADEFGRLNKMPADQIDIFLKNQMIGLSPHGKQLDTDAGNAGYLVHLTDIQALACRVEVRNGGLYLPDSGGRPTVALDTTGAPWMNTDGNTCHLGFEQNGNRGVAGFAMTLNRNLYVHRHSVTLVAGGCFYHSAYTCGEDVVCTGNLTAVNGRLTYVNNASGHYQPPSSQLQVMLEALRAQGIPMAGVTVEIDPQGNADLFSATAFLDNRLVGNRGALYAAAADRIIDVLDAYDERANKWYSRPSQRSKDTSARLDGIIQTSNWQKLYEEVCFCIGRTNQSPLGTPVSEQLTKGELKSKLEAALALP